MSNIKTKDYKAKKIKTKDVKSNIMNISKRANNVKSNLEHENSNELEYGNTIIENTTNEIKNYTIKESSKSIEVSSSIIKKSKTMERTKNYVIGKLKIIKEKSKQSLYVTISAIKMILKSSKSLVSFVSIGGSIASIIVIIICIIGLLFSSIFGIFFSNERKSKKDVTIQEVIRECNEELSEKLSNIQKSNIYDEYVLKGNTASWKDVLIIYSVVSSNENDEIITFDNKKKKILKNIFWKMNDISYKLKTFEIVENEGTIDEAFSDKRVLTITINNKTAEQMKKEYKFTKEQKENYDELMKGKYDNLWNGVIYGLEDDGEYFLGNKPMLNGQVLELVILIKQSVI